MTFTLDATQACLEYARSSHTLARFLSAAAGPWHQAPNVVEIFSPKVNVTSDKNPILPLITLAAGPYCYEEGGAYVNFAARRLGRGVLHEGFVQEEIATFESNLLPVLYTESRRHELEPHLSPDLSVQPQVLRTALKHERQTLLKVA